MRLLIAASACIAVLVACGITGPGMPDHIAVTPATDTLRALGETRQFTAEVVSESGDSIPQPEISWVSADSTIASVSMEGLVTARGAGEVEITAEAWIGDRMTGTATVVVELAND